MKSRIFIVSILLLSACASEPQKEIPVTTPEAPVKIVQPRIPIAGGVETAYIIPLQMPFHARMDTGAETSSLDAKNLKPFERDGEKWIAFDIVNRKNGEKYHFEKPVKRRIAITRTGKTERRYVVHMDIKMGKEIINAEFSLNDREKFDYQILVGRNIINGRFIIDPTLKNTMH